MSSIMATDAYPSSDHVMKAIMASLPSSSTPSSADAADGVLAFSDDCFEDGCSICLEPFSSPDPSIVTNCKHEYHLHCILEWSQRSTECPICCQLLVLMDPTSQALLIASKGERSMRSKNNIRIVREDHEVSHVAPYINDSDLEEQILQHFAATMGRTRYAVQRRRQISPEINSSEVFPSVSFATTSNAHSNYFHDEMENVNYVSDVGLTPTDSPASSSSEPELSPMLTAENGDGPVNHRILFGHSSPDGPQRSSSSEFIAFSESVKAKLSSASARYKESITKSTRGFKEKLLARNSTVKELGRGVQREMSASIAGVARMIERFDLSSKRAGVTGPFSTSSVERPNLAGGGHSLVQSSISESPGAISGDTAPSSDISPSNCTTIPGRVEMSLS